MSDYFKFASENARREFSPTFVNKDDGTVRCSFCARVVEHADNHDKDCPTRPEHAEYFKYLMSELDPRD